MPTRFTVFALALAVLAPSVSHADSSAEGSSRWYMSIEGGLSTAYQDFDPTVNRTIGPSVRFDAGVRFGRVRFGGTTRFFYGRSYSGNSDNPNSYELVLGPSVDVSVTPWLRMGAAALAGGTLYTFVDDDIHHVAVMPYVGGDLFAIFELTHPSADRATYLRLSGTASYGGYEGSLTCGYRF